MYDAQDNWIGVETTETMTLEEAQMNYPETFAQMKKDEPLKDHQ